MAIYLFGKSSEKYSLCMYIGYRISDIGYRILSLSLYVHRERASIPYRISDIHQIYIYPISVCISDMGYSLSLSLCIGYLRMMITYRIGIDAQQRLGKRDLVVPKET
jgi:hypothetical protein